MTQLKARHQVLPLVLALLLALVSCQPPGLLPPSVDPGVKTGTLTVQIDTAIPRTIQPPVDMLPADYEIRGTGPEGNSFSTRTAGGQASISDLVSGDWTITVEARNAANFPIGTGQADIQLEPAVDHALSVQVAPFKGTGALELTVTWVAAQIAAPAIDAELVPSVGLPIPLTFTIGSGTATCKQAAVPTGYYTLVLRLENGQTPVMGAVEVARILKDQTTSGAFNFLEVNLPDGSIQVNITPQMADPLTVNLSGNMAEIPLGGEMALTASVLPAAGNVVYAWYLNGLARSTDVGPSWTFGSDLAAGVYRLDVVAFSADGTRAGSAGCTFRVAKAPVDASVALAWDANVETDLAGYRLYYGTASGDYDLSVNVGKTTTYEVTDLDPERNYYFAVTAYNTAGQESGFSNEVSFMPL